MPLETVGERVLKLRQEVWVGDLHLRVIRKALESL